MPGINPYIEKQQFKLPELSYQITFLPLQKKVQVLSENISTESDGLPGSILSAALDGGIDIEHSCGGVCACSTCHIIVRQGLESCSQATDDEEDMLDLAPGLEPQSRLACQCVPNGTQAMIVEIPEWNRNIVSEER